MSKKLLMRAVFFFMGLFFMALLPQKSQAQGPTLAAPIKWDTSNLSNCYDAPVRLKTLNAQTIMTSLNSPSILVWEYTDADPATNPRPTYTEIARGFHDSIEFVPRFSFPVGQISHIYTQTFRYIRVRLLEYNPVTQVLGNELKVSSATPLKFSPEAPFINGEIIPTTPSCSNLATGVIHVNLTKYADSVLYVVRFGQNNFGLCNPLTDRPPCFNVVKSGKTNQSVFDITGVPSGAFSLLVINLGQDAGSCYNVYNVFVNPQEAIAVTDSTSVSPTCYGYNNGSISMNVYGGNEQTYKFRLSPNLGNFSYSNHQGRFNNLPAGDYTLAFTDTCGVIETRRFKLTQPPKVLGNITAITPTCDNPGNGSIKMYARYNIVTPGFDRFDYKVFKDGVLVSGLANTVDTVFEATGLRGGTYIVKITATSLPDCPGVNDTIILNFNALQASIDSLKPVSCMNGTDGYVRIKSLGGSNKYNVQLRNNATGIVLQDTLGVFDQLSAGTYTAVLRNRSNTCLDSTTLQVTVVQPPSIVAIATKTDVQCFNMSNGTLGATATGGNAVYDYKWEQKLGNNWVAYFQNGASISNVAPGEYRARITDNRSCAGVSDPVVITQPDSLHIDSVTVQDIPCFAGSGHITVHASGGNGGYVQQYRKLPDPAYIDFTPATNLTIGQYVVKIRDAKNCVTAYSDTFTITAPPTNLSFSYVQGVVNGYNITCFGADNGTITISAAGGNGDGYTGYQYTRDNEPWQNSNILTNIPAGNRAIKVRDARGCVVTQMVMFTQPDNSLGLQLSGKTDVKCFGESGGSIRVVAGGGVRPYRFNINGGNWQTDSAFNNLPAGNYTILVKDTNSCTGILQVTLVHQNTAITSTATITDVSCNGGADGAVNAVTGGGVPGYTYLWTPGNFTTATASGLTAGTYNLRVTDNVGCVKDFTYIVKQPAPLAPVVSPLPVCYGSTTGAIIVKPVGGNRPFQYSKNGGATFQADSVFASLPAGNYNIVVKDAKNCMYSTTATVSVISNNPNLNFIMSSNQHAQDTITMKEISWIKPDRVTWDFDPAIIIDPNPLEPKIRFNNFDTTFGYMIKLTGFYPNCVYSVEKNIKIYPFDPNAVVTPSQFNRGIKLAELFPNPNQGQFTLNVEFFKLQRVSVYITSLQGTIVVPRRDFAPTLHLTHNYLSEMNGKPPGTYVLRIVSDYDSRYLLFVKSN
jgi:large repetitive protein